MAEEGTESYQNDNGAKKKRMGIVVFTFLHGFESFEPLLSFRCLVTWACCV